jgi:hypothetical protein
MENSTFLRGTFELANGLFSIVHSFYPSRSDSARVCAAYEHSMRDNFFSAPKIIIDLTLSIR